MLAEGAIGACDVECAEKVAQNRENENTHLSNRKFKKFAKHLLERHPKWLQMNPSIRRNDPKALPRYRVSHF